MCLDTLKKHSSWGPLVLRVVTGLIFVVAGYLKLADQVQGFTGMLEGLGFPIAGVLAWIVAVVELLGGLALILGVYTRYAAMPLAVIIAVAAVIKLSGQGFDPARIDLLLLASNIALMLGGPGAYALKKA